MGLGEHGKEMETAEGLQTGERHDSTSSKLPWLLGGK